MQMLQMCMMDPFPEELALPYHSLAATGEIKCSFSDATARLGRLQCMSHATDDLACEMLIYGQHRGLQLVISLTEQQASTLTACNIAMLHEESTLLGSSLHSTYAHQCASQCWCLHGAAA